MTVVADSGPLIHLAVARQFFLLKRFFDKAIIIPQVYDEVVTQGKGKPGDSELSQALGEGWVVVESVTELTGVRRLVTPRISQTDAAVVACALEREIHLILAYDPDVRELAEQEGLAVIGTVGILVRARLEGILLELRPLLDHLVESGFRLDPKGRIYREALRRVGEAQ
jgi:predicted nucleic acid-binding protein